MKTFSFISFVGGRANFGTYINNKSAEEINSFIDKNFSMEDDGEKYYDVGIEEIVDILKNPDGVVDLVVSEDEVDSVLIVGEITVDKVVKVMESFYGKDEWVVVLYTKFVNNLLKLDEKEQHQID